MGYSATTIAALLGWIPLTAVAFLLLGARLATIVCTVAGWLILPCAMLALPGLPNYSKATAVGAGVLIAAALLDARRFATLRLATADLVVAAWCVVPLASSLANELGWYNGISGAVARVLIMGFPYLAGRLYAGSPDGLRLLTKAIVIGGLVYVPLCLYEIRMSPSLHRLVYGFQASGFDSTRRFGGWRPLVFLQHGLNLGMFMATASMIAYGLWRCGGLRRVAGVPTALAVVVLVVTTVLCKSLGALVLLFGGMMCLEATRILRSRLPLLVLASIPLVYASIRTLGLWSGEGALDLAHAISDERAKSLETRFVNEDRLVAHALRQPMLGWDGWGRNQVQEPGTAATITDGLWIIALGQNGLVGLAAFLGMFVLPIIGAIRRGRLASAPDAPPGAADALVLCIVVGLCAIDNLLNASVDPMMLLCIGGLATYARAPRTPVVAPESVGARNPAAR
jgi:hypothetical protein